MAKKATKRKVEVARTTTKRATSSTKMLKAQADSNIKDVQSTTQEAEIFTPLDLFKIGLGITIFGIIFIFVCFQYFSLKDGLPILLYSTVGIITGLVIYFIGIKVSVVNLRLYLRKKELKTAALKSEK